MNKRYRKIRFILLTRPSFVPLVLCPTIAQFNSLILIFINQTFQTVYLLREYTECGRCSNNLLNLEILGPQIEIIAQAVVSERKI